MSFTKNASQTEKALNLIVDSLEKTILNNQSKIVWLSVDFRMLMSSTGLAPSDAEYGAHYLVEALRSKLSNEHTLLVSTFNFTFPQSKTYDYQFSPIQTGAFGALLTKTYFRQRTPHPFYSFLAFGRYSEFLSSHFFKAGTGKDSIFEWVVENDTLLVCLGHHYVKSLTSIHHAEHCVDVPYRYEKSFAGVSKLEKEEKTIKAGFYVRELGVCDFSSLTLEGDKAFRDAGLVNSKLIIDLRRPILCHSINHKPAHEAMTQNLASNVTPAFVDYFGPDRKRENVITASLADQLYMKELSELTNRAS